MYISVKAACRSTVGLQYMQDLFLLKRDINAQYMRAHDIPNVLQYA